MSPIRLHCVNIGSLGTFFAGPGPLFQPFLGFLCQFAEDRRQHFGQILGDQARSEELRRTAVHPNRGGYAPPRETQRMMHRKYV